MSSPHETELTSQPFQQPIEDDGLALEELSAAYAELLSRGGNPYDEPAAGGSGPAADWAETTDGPAELPAEGEMSPADVCCDLSPKSILEAMLFVGNTGNRPLTSRQVAGLMRGVRPQEIDDLVTELNAEYAAEGRPYSIVSIDSGYALQLREEYASLRDTFYGRVREARLTQAAIDVLAIVAYRQPISRKQLDELRGKPSGGILAQLLRRGLLSLERSEDRAGDMQYRTTERFLQLFGLGSLEELPQSQDALPGEPD